MNHERERALQASLNYCRENLLPHIPHYYRCAWLRATAVYEPKTSSSLKTIPNNPNPTLNQPWLTLLEPQSRCGDKPVKFQVLHPQNGTAVLKALRVQHAAVTSSAIAQRTPTTIVSYTRYHHLLWRYHHLLLLSFEISVTRAIQYGYS